MNQISLKSSFLTADGSASLQLKKPASTQPASGIEMVKAADLTVAVPDVPRAMMLADGLDRQAAARTLEGALEQTLRAGIRTVDMVSAGVAATTREFTEAVLSELPRARTDTEFITREALA